MNHRSLAESICVEIASTVQHNELSHDGYLYLRNIRLFDNKSFNKLCQRDKQAVTEYLRGLIEALWIYGIVKWHVRYNGELVLGKDVPEGTWSQVDEGDFVYPNGGIF
jgi:hypothetical protein